jgi:hypothetical protein
LANKTPWQSIYQGVNSALLFNMYGNILIAVKTTAHRMGSPVCGPSQTKYRFKEASDRVKQSLSAFQQDLWQCSLPT